MTGESLTRLRLRLTAWYVGVLFLILLVLSAGLFLAIRRQLARALDRTLRNATAAYIREVQTREPASPGGEVTIYLLDPTGAGIEPATVPPWVQEVAREAAARGQTDRNFETPDDRQVRVFATRFNEADGRAAIAVAVVSRLELEDEYRALIGAFALAALLALGLAAAGGLVLVRQSTAPIERSMDQMRRFVADAAHELRAPLAVLRSRAEVTLQQPRDSATYASALEAIQLESERLGAIVRDLLTLAHADAGERAVVREPLFLDDLALDAAEAARILAARKGVNLEVGGFEEAAITGDPALLRQLLLNLLDNAIKFTPAGGLVRLDVTAGADGPAVVIEDSGIGIPPDQLPRVFDRFYRADLARGRAEGVGLGLAIARWIADQHGAHIEITSKVGMGTRVLLRFPPAV